LCASGFGTISVLSWRFSNESGFWRTPVSSVKSVLICYPQVPFVKGGTELLVEGLRAELARRDYDVEVVSIPFRWFPKREIIRNCMAWRLLDLTQFEGRKVDFVICTKFPSYLVEHPHKITYLVHQFRQAYDMHGSKYGTFNNTPQDNGIREMIVEMDNRFLPQSKVIFTISKNVSKRLRHYNNLESEVLNPPPRLEGRFSAGPYGDYLLYVGRLNRTKRVDLLIRSLADANRKVECRIVGSGEEKQALERLAAGLGLEDRVRFLGYADDEDLLQLYAGCFGVYYAPHDEDYGLATVEAFSARRPVITTVDSGGVLEFVEDGITGCVAKVEPTSIASKIDNLFFNRELCKRLGEGGHERVKEIRWEKVAEKLLQAAHG
jgi:glycosyltransferase involved in cell wall biosynthesis